VANIRPKGKDFDFALDSRSMRPLDAGVGRPSAGHGLLWIDADAGSLTWPNARPTRWWTIKSPACAFRPRRPHPK